MPYSSLTKVVSSGLLPHMKGRISGFELLPTTAMASMLTMIVMVTALRWWKHAGHRVFCGVRLPFPGRWTALSGMCGAGIIVTTALAYTFKGISIIFVMLLMRGGVLAIAPVVDFVGRRQVRWFSWVALGLSLVALGEVFRSATSLSLTGLELVNILVYLVCYFGRLHFMSHVAKSDDPQQSKRYFVEEQLAAQPTVLLALIGLALINDGSIMHHVRMGFTSFLLSGVAPEAFIIGALTQGTGLFGALVLLDRRENTYCVPVNRASSVLAGIIATYSLTLFLDEPPPDKAQLVSALFILGAIFVLALPPLWEQRRRSDRRQGRRGEEEFAA